MAAISRIISSFGSIQLNPMTKNEELWNKIEQVYTRRHVFDPAWKTQYTPLTFAIRELNSIELCDALIEDGADISESDASGKTPLEHAICLRYEEIASFLIDFQPNLQTYNGQGLTFLHDAATKGLINICAKLIEKGIDINSVGFPIRDWESVSEAFESLPHEVKNDMRNLLLNKGFSWTPLHLAVFSKQVEVVRWLLQKGAKLQPDYLGITPLIYAFTYSNIEIEIVELLIEEEADILKKYPMFMMNRALDINLPMCLICKNNSKGLEYLIDSKKLDLNQELEIETDCLEQKIEHENLLSISALLKFPNIVSLLIKKGADTNYVITRGRTPLHGAVSGQNNAACIDLLLDAGAEAKTLNSSLETPLYLAYLHRSQAPDTIEKLIEKDEGLTDAIINIKVIAQRFGIKGQIYNMRAEITLPVLIKSLETFITVSPDQAEYIKIALELLKVSDQHMHDCDFFIGKAAANFPAVFSLEWPEHAICGAIYGKYFLTANRGEGSDCEPGYSCYIIKKPENQREAFEKLFAMETSYFSLFKNNKTEKTVKKEASISFFNEGIVKLLDLERQFFMPQQHQPSGNCPMVAAQEMLLFSLIIAGLLKGKTLDEAHLGAISRYKKWSKFDRMCRLNQLQEIEQGKYRELLEKHINFEELNKSILLRSLRGTRIPIFSAILNKNLPLLEPLRDLIKPIMFTNTEQTLKVLHQQLQEKGFTSIPFELLARFCCEIHKGFAYQLHLRIESDPELHPLAKLIKALLLGSASNFMELLDTAKKEENTMKRDMKFARLSEMLAYCYPDLAMQCAQAISDSSCREIALDALAFSNL